MKRLLRNCKHLVKIRQTLFSKFYRNTIIYSWLGTRLHDKKKTNRRKNGSFYFSVTYHNLIRVPVNTGRQLHRKIRILGLFVSIHNHNIKTKQVQIYNYHAI